MSSLATPTNPPSDAALVAQFMQGWPAYPSSGQPSGPVGIYKVATLEANRLQNPNDINVNLHFDADNHNIDLGLGANLSTLQISAPSASSVLFNATSTGGADSAFIFESGNPAHTTTLQTSGAHTSIVSTADGISLSTSDPVATGSAQFVFSPAAVTLQSGSAADQQLNLFGANVEVRGAQLNANADVLVKSALALQKVNATTLAIAQKLSGSDVSVVTIGGVGGGAHAADTVATFATDGAGIPHTWLNGSSAYFSGAKVGLNWSVPPVAEPTVELDVNGTIYARTAVQTSNVFNVASSNVMTIGWGMSSLLDPTNLKKIVLQSDVIEMVGDINQMNKTDLRIDDTAIYLGFIPGQTTMDGVVDAANAAPPGTYDDTHYDGSGLILWNLPDGYQNFYNSPSVPAPEKPVFADYQQSFRWYKRGGMFDNVSIGNYVPAWNRSSWEVAGGNLTLAAGTGHANYMFAIDYTDDSLKLYKVDSSTIKEVANFNSLT